MDADVGEKRYKVVVIGNANVGKTALTYRLAEGKYCENPQITVGVDLRRKTMMVDNEKITLYLWDTAGLERNRQSLNSHYYRDVKAAILVYDLTNEKSFDELPRWVDELRQHCDANPDIIKVLIGNKCDGDVVVSRQKAQKFAFDNDFAFFETSAKLDEELSNIEGIFLTIAHKLKANALLTVNREAAFRLQQNSTPTDSSSCSC